MSDDSRVYAIRNLLFEYVKSPSLRHICDPYALNKLAHEITRQFDRSNSTSRKWEGLRESF